MEKSNVGFVIIILIIISLVPGCIETSDDEIELTDRLIYVPISEIVNNTTINHRKSTEGWNLTLCLELVKEKFHAFKEYEYDNVTGMITPQPGNDDYNIFFYYINGSLHGRKDNYLFNFEYHDDNKSFTLRWESINRHAIPNEVRNEILNLAQTNETMFEFFDKYPEYHEYYEWYSDTDNRSTEHRTPKEYYSEFENSTLESNLIRASFGAPGGWIPESHPHLECLIDLSTNYSIIKYINRIP
jgi:hypothetical protein